MSIVLLLIISPAIVLMSADVLAVLTGAAEITEVRKRTVERMVVPTVNILSVGKVIDCKAKSAAGKAREDLKKVRDFRYRSLGEGHAVQIYAHNLFSNADGFSKMSLQWFLVINCYVQKVESGGYDRHSRYRFWATAMT